MNLKALGYKSDLIFNHFDGVVIDRGDYLVVKTPTNPNFFWGNMLLFAQAPRRGEAPRWIELFKQEFPDPNLYHMTFGWDGEISDQQSIQPFLNNGFKLEKTVVLVLDKLIQPQRIHPHLNVRALQDEEEWKEMIKIQLASALDHLSLEEWEKFYRSQSIRYKKMTLAGWGNWFGGFVDHKLVAGLGFFYYKGLGRFQVVCTHPDYRRQGICSALVYQVTKYAQESLSLNHIVMCADPDYHAAKIYESVGFKPLHVEAGLCWWDKKR